MFTGIIQAAGTLQESRETGGDRRMRFDAEGLDLQSVAIGDSIAVNGCCLTAVEVDAKGFAADVSLESLARTTLGRLAPGDDRRRRVPAEPRQVHVRPYVRRGS